MSTKQKMSEYQNYIFTSRYARYRDDLGRRETWDEAIDRVHQFWKEHLEACNVPANSPSVLTELDEAMEAMRNMEIMGSMRVMMSAGKALHEHHVAGYNCAYTPIDDLKRFSEILYILMCGTGVGFSVERDEIEKLPIIPSKWSGKTTIVVPDTKLGWAESYRRLIDALVVDGVTPAWDLTQIRPYGARLKTMGGRASGPEPLNSLFQYTVETIKAAAGRQLTSIEIHDLVCKIADIVVVGGVRRSALISLSNLTDDRMRHAKSGEWWRPEVEGGSPFRALANNSVAYTTKPDVDSYLREMTSLFESRAGERGIFSREAAKNSCPTRRDPNHEFGTNPCSEIILRPQEFCNLTEVIVRSGDTEADLLRKIKHATFLGTLQSTLTEFNFLSPEWHRNCEEERLLGVSLTGIQDHRILGRWSTGIVKDDTLTELLLGMKRHAATNNRRVAKKLGIEPSAAITCVKPSGTVSQLCNTASGIHPRYAEYYIRRVVADNKDPLCEFMKNQGFPWEPSVSNEYATVFSFPVASPKGAITRHDLSAIDQLDLWRMYNEAYCEHKPSITVYYKDEEFPEVMSYVWNNFDEMSGVSFLPSGDDHIYTQAPYEEITEAKYKQLLKAMPKNVDWQGLSVYENEDSTSVQPELACHGGACEL